MKSFMVILMGTKKEGFINKLSLMLYIRLKLVDYPSL
jgi:hypothetical protein